MRIHINIDDDKIEIIKKIKQETKISISQIINFLISKYSKENDDRKDKNRELLDIKNKKVESNKYIRINISNEEYQFLMQEAQKNGFNMTSKEIKYRLLNTIHNNKYFTSMELENFSQARSEINVVGRNLNRLLKLLHTRNIIKFDSKDFKKSIDNLNDKIDKLSDELGELLIRSNQRY
ncbi:hypothetical protein [Campylobacter fetus]|uniref:hypothetical protein n=1 Tax=Campylobacter fetus TaxID=196 RepID=UPI000818AE66|nr:hypothetical protein [Campylobacter fetus]OCR84628.1 hypothetical protein CFT12S05168_08895 [Campylobacter fetus subsp. testudinum]OCR95657.1 hypothetical protein CFT12S02847_07545 [Campylobacter fetus subsp. testudinum]